MNIFKLLRPNNYFNHYSRIDKTQSFFSTLLLLPYLISKGFGKNLPVLRFYRSCKKKITDVEFTDPLPSIELLIVCTRKDFETLPFCIKQGLKHSKNPVSKITVVVPENDVEYILNILTIVFDEIEVISENSVIDLSDRLNIKRVMGSRYGWALQQFITVAIALNSKSIGVLAINADTILLRDQAWLDETGKQILMESYEYNSKYYEAIEAIQPKFGKISESHITHHMLFQPKIVRETLNFMGALDMSTYIDLFMRNVDDSSNSPICVEFEPYANFLRLKYPEKIEKVKFSNISVKPTLIDGISNTVSKYEELNVYNSISLHSWMN